MHVLYIVQAKLKLNVQCENQISCIAMQARDRVEEAIEILQQIRRSNATGSRRSDPLPIGEERNDCESYQPQGPHSLTPFHVRRSSTQLQGTLHHDHERRDTPAGSRSHEEVHADGQPSGSGLQQQRRTRDSDSGDTTSIFNPCTCMHAWSPAPW